MEAHAGARTIEAYYASHSQGSTGALVLLAVAWGLPVLASEGKIGQEILQSIPNLVLIKGKPPLLLILGMVMSLAALPGKTRSQIEALLGPSLETPYFASTGRDMIYILGPERSSFAIDSDLLLIWLDDNGRFLRYTIATNQLRMQLRSVE